MLSLSRRTVIATSMVAAIGIAVPAALAATSGGGTPANKAVAAGSTVQDIQPSATGTQIMQATFKTSKPEDLLMSVSLECSIITTVVAPGSSTANSSSAGEAAGTIKVWLTIENQGDASSQRIVPITDVSSPPQDPSQQRPGTDADKVTFCDRDHKVSLKDTESLADGTDELSEYQFTKTANAFNWVRLNAGSGIHVVRTWAQFLPSDPNDTVNKDATTTAGSESAGFVGNRTLVIEPTKLANSAVIADSGTSTSGQ